MSISDWSSYVVSSDLLGVDGEEWRRSQQRQGAGDAAAGFQQFAALVGNRHRDVAAGSEMLADLAAEPVNVDHGAAHAGLDQPVDAVIEQAAPGDGDQRLEIARAHV